MIFRKKQNSPVERRLAELQEEMARVQRQLRRAAACPAAPPAAPPPPPPPPPAASVAASADGSGLDPAAGDLFFYGAGRGAARGSDLFPERASRQERPAAAGAPAASGRERFANYFTAGHFPELRPVRQDSRMLRNKAIIMLIAAALLAAWLVYVFLQ